MNTSVNSDQARLDSHKRVLGIIYIITGSLALLSIFIVQAILNIVFSFAMPQADAEEQRIIEFVTTLVSILPWILAIFYGIPSIIAGWGLMTKQSWATVLALVVGILKLLNVPIGTAIGAYAIWVYAEDQRLSRLQPTS